jgi:hypothetical protein
MPAKPAGEAPSAAASSGAEGGIDGLRTTAKWLIGALAVVGAALLTGVSLSSVGSTGDTLRDVGAAVAALVGLGGVVLAIAAVSDVLTPGEITLGEMGKNAELADLITEDPSLLKGAAPSFAKLNDDYEAALSAYQTARAASEAAPKDQRLSAAAEAKQSRLKQLTNPIQGLRRLALYLKVRQIYRSARLKMLGGVAVAAIGLLTFVGLAHKPEKPAKTASLPSFQAVSRVSVTPMADERTALGAQLGAACPLGRLAALAIGGTLDAVQVVTLPTSRCKPIKFTVTPDLGTVVGTSPPALRATHAPGKHAR